MQELFKQIDDGVKAVFEYDNARALFAGVLSEQESIEECIYPEK